LRAHCLKACSLCLRSDIVHNALKVDVAVPDDRACERQFLKQEQYSNMPQMLWFYRKTTYDPLHIFSRPSILLLASVHTRLHRFSWPMVNRHTTCRCFYPLLSYPTTNACTICRRASEPSSSCFPTSPEAMLSLWITANVIMQHRTKHINSSCFLFRHHD